MKLWVQIPVLPKRKRKCKIVALITGFAGQKMYSLWFWEWIYGDLWFWTEGQALPTRGAMSDLCIDLTSSPGEPKCQCDFEAYFRVLDISVFWLLKISSKLGGVVHICDPYYSGGGNRMILICVRHPAKSVPYLNKQKKPQNLKAKDRGSRLKW
jgi:hypothetical protein